MHGDFYASFGEISCPEVALIHAKHGPGFKWMMSDLKVFSDINNVPVSNKICKVVIDYNPK